MVAHRLKRPVYTSDSINVCQLDTSMDSTRYLVIDRRSRVHSSRGIGFHILFRYLIVKVTGYSEIVAV